MRFKAQSITEDLALAVILEASGLTERTALSTIFLKRILDECH